MNCRWMAFGIVSIIAGVMLLLAELFIHFDAGGRAEASAAFGAGMLLFGTMTLYTQALLRMMSDVNRPADDAWTDGHGAGFDKGWRECAKQSIRPVTKIHRLPAVARVNRDQIAENFRR